MRKMARQRLAALAILNRKPSPPQRSWSNFRLRPCRHWRRVSRRQPMRTPATRRVSAGRGAGISLSRGFGTSVGMGLRPGLRRQRTCRRRFRRSPVQHRFQSELAARFRFLPARGPARRNGPSRQTSSSAPGQGPDLFSFFPCRSKGGRRIRTDRRRDQRQFGDTIDSPARSGSEG